MSRRSLITSMVATALITSALFAAGCKKEEQAKEQTPPAAAPAQQAAAPAGPAVVSYGFEKDIEGWVGTDKEVKTEQTGEQKHGDKRSLRVSGTAGSGRWNFTGSPKVQLEPGKKYMVTGWMLVKSWDKADFPPLLKVAIEQDGKFASNAFTKRYNMKRSNQWQEVNGTFETPKGGAITGFIALEKGTQDPINATLYLDDVKIVPAQ